MKIMGALYTGTDIVVIQHLINNAQYPGITSQTGYNAFFISLGIGILSSRLLVVNRFKWIYIISIVLYFVGLIFTGKRSLLLANILAIVILFVTTHKKLTLKKILLYFCSTLLLLLLCYLAVNYIPQTQTIFEKFNGEDVSSGRFSLFKEAFNLFETKPLVGYGINTFAQISPSGLDTHNVYLQLLAEVGLVGTIFIIGPMIYLFIFSLKIYRLNFGRCQYIALSLYIQIIFLVYSALGNPFYNTNLFLAYLVFTSMVLSYYTTKRKRSLEN
ncbi:O-antigen ligase family protein [Priestia megaterium]|uniref:O-antigen ligase family protein n=1 Tax=Priestia megaterium TaxID=1404 RepID=UPI002FFD5BDD